MQILVYDKIGIIVVRVPEIVKNEQTLAGVFDKALVFRAEVIAVHHNPGGVIAPRQIDRRHGVVRAAQLRHAQSHDLHPFGLQSAVQCLGGGCHRENGLAAGVMPGLGESQTPHGVARADARAYIHPDQTIHGLSRTSPSKI